MVESKEEGIEGVNGRQEEVIAPWTWMRVDLMIHVEGYGGGRERTKKSRHSGGERRAPAARMRRAMEVEDEWGRAKAAVGGSEGIEDLGR
jgi:hypothetical protein